MDFDLLCQYSFSRFVGFRVNYDSGSKKSSSIKVGP